MAKYGETLARQVALRVSTPVASVAALQAVGADDRADGMVAVNSADNTKWIFNAASTAADTSNQLVITPTSGSGRWIRFVRSVTLKAAVAFGTADAAVLFTVPVGFRLQLKQAFWEITTQFAGGTSSAIGLSSSNTGYNTKGDLLGGAGGDLTAALTAGYRGAVGTKLATNGLVVLVAGDTIRFDRIASVYTSGAGFAHIPVDLLA